MYDKIKAGVSARVAEILDKDAEAFEFFKKDGSLNKNAFVTRLIVNYNAAFRAREARIFDVLKSGMEGKSGMGGEKLNFLCRELVLKLERRGYEGVKSDKTVSVKPTRESAPVIDYIENYCLSGGSLSEYFRNMFTAYTSLPQDEREKIIFLPQYNAITQAIAQGKQLFLVTSGSSDGRRMQVQPYSVVTSKEEMHCYLLAANTAGECLPLRLSRIISVVQIEEDTSFTGGQLATFARMAAFGPQYRYSGSEEEVVVRLTEKGIKMFRAMYVHRPVPTKIDVDRYHFNCSYMQLFQYFVRFGKDAFIVKPAELRDRIKRFYAAGIRSYKASEKEN